MNNKKNELYHHGVKGMKWGVRHDKNPNYTSDQRKRDKDVYGSSGVRRINKNMNKGHSLSGSRSMEASRIANSRKKARLGGQVGSVVGGITGAVAGYRIAPEAVTMVDMILDLAGKRNLSYEESRVVRAAISAGSAVVGRQIGRYGGQSIAMLSSGYSHKKYR